MKVFFFCSDPSISNGIAIYSCCEYSPVFFSSGVMGVTPSNKVATVVVSAPQVQLVLGFLGYKADSSGLAPVGPEPKFKMAQHGEVSSQPNFEDLNTVPTKHSALFVFCRSQLTLMFQLLPQ